MQRKTHLVSLNNYMAGDENKDKPLKKKKDSKKSVTPSVNSEPNPKEVEPAIVKVIRDALAIQIADMEEKKRKVNELEAMLLTCQEFMKSFIILGYDINGQPIPPLVHANSQQEADALGAYMSKFINHHIKEINNQEE